MRNRAALPAIAALLLGVSPWLTWWTTSFTTQLQDVELRVSLYQTTACDGDHCVSGLSDPSWSALGWITLAVVLLAALVAGVLAQRRRMRADVASLERAMRLVGSAALVTILVAIGWAVIDRGGTPSFGPLLATTGAGLALYAAAHEPFAIPDAAVGAPARVGPGASRASSELRFAIASASIEPDGLRAGDRLLAWRDVARVVARRLPPDPPWEKATFLDLVPAVGAPMRLVSSTRIDYAALPGGAAPTAKGNWRRLIAVARHANDSIEIDDESAPFFDGRQAAMFPAWKAFLAYDAQYDAT